MRIGAISSRRGWIGTWAVLWLLVPCAALALDPQRSLYQFCCENWSRQNGLPVNGISAITQTRDGYLWLGTQNGLIRFDGVEFKPVKPPESFKQYNRVINCLTPRPEGGLWFGLDSNAYGSYDELGNWRSGKGLKGSVPYSVVALVPAKDGGLLVAGSTSFLRRADSSTKPVFDQVPETASIEVSSAVRDATGRIWLGTLDHGLYYWQDGKLNEFPDRSLAQEFISALAVDHAGNLWLGTARGLISYDPQFHRREIGFPGNQVTALLVDHQGTLWIGLADSGLARWEGEGFSLLRKSDGLVGDSVLSLAEDREGSLWVGTREGLSQLMDVKFPLVTEKEGIPGAFKLSVSASPRGGLWVATGDGIVYFDNWGTRYSTESGLRNPYVKRVFEASNGDVFTVSGRNEVEVMVNGQVVARHETPGMAVALTEDSDGVVVSVAGELYRVGRDIIQPYPFAGDEKPLLYWVVNLMTSRDGAIWVSCVNGICRVKDGRFQQWTTDQGLADANVRGICEDPEGVIWAGTPSGIARLKEGQIRNIREEDGLFDGNIYAMIPDDYGSLWVDSVRGLYGVKLKSLNDFAEGRSDRVECTAYDAANAMKPADKYKQENSGCKTLDGRIWFPSQEGVIMIDPAKVVVNRLAPRIEITRVHANNADLELTHRATLPPGGGELAFYYTALTFIAPQKVRFKYQLVGHDPDWVEAGDRRMAFYTNLKPGQYTFRVKACNADGIWNEAGASMEVEIPPRFYQTKWFAGLVGVLVVVGLAGVYGISTRHSHLRQQMLQRANELLDSKVRERTHELVEQRNLLRTLIDHLPDSIFVKDTEGRVLVDNMAHARLLGVQSPEEMVGKTDFDCLPNELAKKFHADERAVLQSGEPFDAEESLVHLSTGEKRWLRTTKVPLRDSAGQTIGLAGIHRDITDRKQWEASREELHQQLVQTSRQAGMAEVATSVLHNVGNVLNSVNTSSGLILDLVRSSQLTGLERLVELLDQQGEDLMGFFNRDHRASQIAGYLKSLSSHLATEHETLVSEAEELARNVEHIKGIVVMQQTYARVGGLVEPQSVLSLIEDALRVHVAGLEKRGVQLIRRFDAVPVVPLDKHKVLQILVNLISNAQHALAESTGAERILTVGASLNGDNRIRVFVEDNGVGISPENLTRIFSHGFTTRRNGHGFGLHSGALAAREMGGALIAESDGLGKGARFTLELPNPV